MKTPDLNVIHRTDPELAQARRTERAHALLDAFLEASDADRGQAFWAFYRMLDPGLTSVPSGDPKGDAQES